MKKIFLIRESNPQRQLELFFENLKNENLIPMIAPSTFDSSHLEKIVIPDHADFAVASSGTTGKPKIYFRTINSWKNFLPVQNKAFGVDENSRIFIHGSQAFTGNLNIAFDAVETGSFLYCSSSLRSSLWAREIKENHINFIYMIPDKLLHLCKTREVFPEIKTVLCGSQFVSKDLFLQLKKNFPFAKIIVYYGASETNYISYKILQEENYNLNCIGKIFDEVKVKISAEGTICIKSDFCILGINGFYDTKDLGFVKNNLIYLNGRSDDVINAGGEKINSSIIAEKLLAVEGIEECLITTEIINGKNKVTAHIAGKNLPESIKEEVFEGIEKIFIPSVYKRYRYLPKNESGKILLYTSNKN